MKRVLIFVSLVFIAGALSGGVAVMLALPRGQTDDNILYRERTVMSAPASATAFAEALCHLDAKTLVAVTDPSRGVTEAFVLDFLARRGPTWCETATFIGATSVNTPGERISSMFLLSGNGQSDYAVVSTDLKSGLVVDLAW